MERIKFRCLEDCGLCCSYKVALLPEDIRRIVEKGYRKDEFSDNGFLLKKRGYCVFLGKDLKCKIYNDRPAYCRSFPFYVEEDGIDVNLSCPGIGKGNEFKIEFDECMPTGTSRVKDEILQKFPGYVSEDKFKEVGLRWCESLSDVTSIGEILDSSHEEYQHYTGIHAHKIEPDLFSIPDGRGIHFTPEGKIVRYQFDLKDSTFKIDKLDYQLRECSSSLHLSVDTIREIVDYLRFWFGRSIFYRFCLITSIGIPRPESAFAIAFSFIRELSEKIVAIKHALSLHWGVSEDAVDLLSRPTSGQTMGETGKSEQNEENILREAIRVVDGRLRTKCQGARVETGVCKSIVLDQCGE